MPQNTSHLRQPAVAGQFYPEDPAILRGMLKQFFAECEFHPISRVKAIIAPHAGYIYSGAIAASAYQTLMPQIERIKRVVLLGPSHRVGFHGLATSSASHFRTPIGDIPIDKTLQRSIEALPQVTLNDRAHMHEHCLEVQLPFLQKLLDDFTLLPLLVGDCNGEQVAEVLELVWGGDDTLIVISSDLSHYHGYDEAVAMDRRTSDLILDMRPDEIEFDDACGRIPIRGLLLAASAHGLTPKMVDLRNSGDTAGSRDRVVGYGAYVFSE